MEFIFLAVIFVGIFTVCLGILHLIVKAYEEFK